MQIRFIMKARDTWKMKFDDLLPQLSLLQPKRPRVFEMRLWVLADAGFVKLTFKDEDEHVDEVEIEIHQAMEEN